MIDGDAIGLASRLEPLLRIRQTIENDVATISSDEGSWIGADVIVVGLSDDVQQDWRERLVVRTEHPEFVSAMFRTVRDLVEFNGANKSELFRACGQAVLNGVDEKALGLRILDAAIAFVCAKL